MHDPLGFSLMVVYTKTGTTGIWTLFLWLENLYSCTFLYFGVAGVFLDIGRCGRWWGCFNVEDHQSANCRRVFRCAVADMQAFGPLGNCLRLPYDHPQLEDCPTFDIRGGQSWLRALLAVRWAREPFFMFGVQEGQLVWKTGVCMSVSGRLVFRFGTKSIGSRRMHFGSNMTFAWALLTTVLRELEKLSVSSSWNRFPLVLLCRFCLPLATEVV